MPTVFAEHGWVWIWTVRGGAIRMNLATVATQLCLSTLAVAVWEFPIDCWRSAVKTVEADVVDHSA